VLFKRLGFRGVAIGTNIAGAEISRGRDAFWAKGLNAAKLLKITGRLKSMGIPAAKARAKR
jgi:hypothetical protein